MLTRGWCWVMSRPECIAVSPENAEEARRLLRRMGLYVDGYKAMRLEEGKVAFPVRSVREALRVLMQAGVEASECRAEFPARRRPSSLRETGLPLRGYSLVGDIAVFSYTGRLAGLEEYRAVAESLIREQPRIKAVYLKVATRGELRVARLIHLAGEARTWTVHREYGLEFEVDIARAYFNPRLGYEHRRVAELARDGETMLDMFSGVGGFAIHAAALRRVRVLAVDLNPYAVRLAARNLWRNRRKLKGSASVARADASFLPGLLEPIYDRIVMNHPTASKAFAWAACKLVSPRGAWIHYYTLTVSCIQAKEEAVEAFSRCCEIVREEGCREVLPHSPNESIYVVDLTVKKRRSMR